MEGIRWNRVYSIGQLLLTSAFSYSFHSAGIFYVCVCERETERVVEWSLSYITVIFKLLLEAGHLETDISQICFLVYLISESQNFAHPKS